MRFVREWIGGPMEGHMAMVSDKALTVEIVNGEQKLGTYTLRDDAWHWKEAISQETANV